MYNLSLGNCLDVMKTMDGESIDAIITDPPYALTQTSRNGSPRNNNPDSPFGRHRIGERGFMGKTWDNGQFAHNPELWLEALRVAKPGAHLLSFGGTRTFHRLACAIEDAGWEIRDTIMWVYGSGFPKNLDVSTAIDKKLGAEREIVEVVDPRSTFDGIDRQSKANNTNWRAAENREDIRDLSKKTITSPATEPAKQWEGWGTSLKPAWEPILVARKPLVGTVATNVLEYGTGAINIDECRIEPGTPIPGGGNNFDAWRRAEDRQDRPKIHRQSTHGHNKGRYPANVIHDGSDEVVDLFPSSNGTGGNKSGKTALGQGSGWNAHNNRITEIVRHNDTGSTARFFYCAKTSKKERGEGNNHPTVKPIALMKYLCKLVTPPNGVVLDPFCGSGSTGLAALELGFKFHGIELEKAYLEIAKSRLEKCLLN